jgi:alpha,alpha-trehalase
MTETFIYELEPLFRDVQMSRIFPDGKTFVDSEPQKDIRVINENYQREKEVPGFNLKRFVLSNFILPEHHSSRYHSDLSKSVEENIDSLWRVLTREPGTGNGSIIPLPFPYIVPGGRFGEIYYWDSYFTMLGLKEAGNITMIEHMVNNFSFLIDRFGYIPNGNRAYFIGRSQPPFYSLMVELLVELKGKEVLIKYLPQLQKEYEFWMRGAHAVHSLFQFRTVQMPDGSILNRYYDEHDTPRPEAFAVDIELAERSSQKPSELFRHLRAGAESGWDYSCRWFRNEDDFSTIHTTDIVPVDLNGLLHHLELTLAKAYVQTGDQVHAAKFRELASARAAAVNKYCWNEKKGYYFDYDRVEQVQKDCYTLAGITPLFFGFSDAGHADQVASVIKEKFLAAGGVVNTLKITGQQWDAPNGWAPLHWMTIKGLERYGHHELAAEIAGRWIRLNRDVYKRTGKLMEKYNVVDTHLEAGGGEYEGQDGFGWTNGVLLALTKKYGANDP